VNHLARRALGDAGLHSALRRPLKPAEAAMNTSGSRVAHESMKCADLQRACREERLVGQDAELVDPMTGAEKRSERVP